MPHKKVSIPASRIRPLPFALKYFLENNLLINEQSPRNRALFEKLSVAQMVKYSPPVVEPEGSLPCSQEPDNGSCHKPDECSLHNKFQRSISAS
jgi:hypothetical protein